MTIDIEAIRAEFLRGFGPPLRPAPPAKPKYPRGVRRKPWGKLGIKGVYPTPTGRFVAKVRRAGQAIALGTFDRVEDAAKAVKEFEAREQS